MCSLGDDNFDDIENSKYMPEKPKITSSIKCNKCREASPCVVLRAKDRYCKDCFLTGTVHKFRASLGKHKLIRPKDRVLVVHKGGHPSTALLHFVRTGLDLNTYKKLRYEPVIIFVENHLHLSAEDRQNLVRRVELEAETFGFNAYFVSLTTLISNQSIEDSLVTKSSLLQISEDDKSRMDAFLSQQRNKTNKNDFLNTITRQNLVEIAKHLKCKFIFTPELSVDIAAQLLTDVSLGRGSHIPLDTGFCDDRDDDVKILRPLRLFDVKELIFYNYFNNLEPVTYTPVKENHIVSVQSLMRKFVSDLQVNYPATVTTVLKTGDKLALGDKSTDKCEFCKAPLGTEALELSSAESTSFSHWVSTQIPDYAATPQERYSKTLETFNNQTCDKYCYSCRKLMKK